jgi:hypothetical protein
VVGQRRITCHMQQVVRQHHPVRVLRHTHAAPENPPLRREQPPVLHPDEQIANRTSRFGTGDRKRSLNDSQRPNFRGVRVTLGTGYNPGEGNRRASRSASSPGIHNSQLSSRTGGEGNYQNAAKSNGVIWWRHAEPMPRGLCFGVALSSQLVVVVYSGLRTGRETQWETIWKTVEGDTVRATARETGQWRQRGHCHRRSIS